MVALIAIMPKIAIYKQYIFFVYSFDLLHEPLHLHIANQKSHRQYTAKIWLSSLEYAEPGSLNQIELNSIQKVVKRYQSQLIIALEFLQNGKGIQTIKMR